VAGLVAAALISAGSVPASGSGARVGAVLRIGTSGDYPPFSERYTSSGAVAYRGFDISVAERFARDAGYSPEWIPFRWSDLECALEAGRFDVAMSGVTVRPERTIRGRFTVAVAETGAVVLVRAGVVPGGSAALQPVHRLAALDVPSMRIAVNAGGHLERVARAHFRVARVDAIPDNAAVGRALAEGTADAVVTELVESQRWSWGLAGVNVIGPLTRDHKAYWLPPAKGDLAAELDAWLLERERDGWLAELRETWFGPAATVATATPFDALVAACDERLALMPYVAEAKRRDGRAVVDPAQEQRVIRAAEEAVAGASIRLRQPAPDPAIVRRFFRAQIDAAVEIQRATLAHPPVDLQPFDLRETLRPALMRVGDRIARLLVRAGAQQRESPARRRSEAVLARRGLSDPVRAAIFDALRTLERKDGAPALE